MIICLPLLCGYAKAQTRGGDSSPPLPKEISAELFDKAVALIKEFEGWHSAKHYPYIGYGHKLLPHENLTADITEAQADVWIVFRRMPPLKLLDECYRLVEQFRRNLLWHRWRRVAASCLCLGISAKQCQTNNHQLYSHRFSFSDWLWWQTPDKRVPATVG